jgi:lysophospholipase L1-like esterase
MAFAPGGIVFAGSSSIRYWDTLVADMAPLRVLGQGFGGSKLSQLVTWTDRLIISHRPRAVVVYSGENDLAGLLGSRRKTAEDLVPMFAQICERVHTALPLARIYWVSIKKPPARREIWPEIDRANDLLAEFCAGDPRLGVIDVLTPMCDSRGEPRLDLYGADGIHLNESGYAVWTAVIRPRLLAETPEP